MKRRLPTPAMAVACTALFVSLAGTGYAVTVLPKNSVGTAQLRNKAVTIKKLAPDAVVSTKVVDGSLLAADFKQGEIPQGPKGDKGDKGDTGDKGAPGATNVVVRSFGAGPKFGFHQETALCNQGESATGGGGYAGGWKLVMSQPVVAGGRPTGWTAAVDESVGTFVSVYVVCASP